MKIGIHTYSAGYSVDPAVLAARAEELGFESFWVPEHPIIPVAMPPVPIFEDGVLPDHYSENLDPFVALGRASAVTQTIRLGIGVCLVPERNPLVVAKEAATVDFFSGGRLMLGIGVGWIREETEIMGGDFPHRWSQAYEFMRALKELWTKEESEYHGNYYDFPPVQSFPKPAQVPHLPIFMGSNRPYAPRRVVELAEGWMPVGFSPEKTKEGRAKLDRLAEKAGRDPRSIELTAFGLPGQYRDRTLVEALFEAGADRVIVLLTSINGDEVLAEMEEVAGTVL